MIMTMHNDKRNNGASKESDKQSYGNTAIYTRKTAIFERDKELNDNTTQRLICAVTVRFNIEDELSVSLKRYDENRYDASGEEYNEEDIENRPVLRELFADIKGGVVDTVVVYSMAILSTKLKTVDKIARIFKEHGVRLILASEGVDTLMPSGRRFFLHLSNLVNYELLGDKKEYFKTKDEENV
jgi:hypothetical protein